MKVVKKRKKVKKSNYETNIEGKSINTYSKEPQVSLMQITEMKASLYCKMFDCNF